MTSSVNQFHEHLRALASEAQHSDVHARLETDLLDDIAIALRQAADALAAERNRAERAEANLAEAWDGGAAHAVGYSAAPLYDNPYRPEPPA